MFKRHKAQGMPFSVVQRRTELERFLYEARHFEGVPVSEVPDCPLRARRDERVYLSAQGAFLVEPKRGPGHWTGGSQGLSVHVPGTKSMRYRIGATRGQFMAGEERPTPIDEGTFVVSSERAVFIGAKQTREWAWSKLLGVIHSDDAPWTSIAVSNRQKTSGVLYDKQNEEQVRFALDLAIARAEGTAASLIAQLESELSTLPAPPPPPDVARPEISAAPPGWLPDPARRYDFRYWDGSKWTDNVSRAGVQSSDPL